MDRVRAEGRTQVLSDCWEDSAGVEFAGAMGMDQASVFVWRRQDLRSLDWPHLDAEYSAAESRGTGYELVRVAGPTPEDMLADVVTMTAAINDAPTDDLDVEDEVFTPERIRAFEAARIANKDRFYRVVARHRGTGLLAGHTVSGSTPNIPDTPGSTTPASSASTAVTVWAGC